MELNTITIYDLQTISDKLKFDENILKVEFSSKSTNSITLIWFDKEKDSEREIGSISIDNNYQVTTSNISNFDIIKIQKIVSDYFKQKNK